MFEAALENCALKGEVFDIQVDLVTKNKKRYWLHYYAKRKQVGGETLIVGTVRDITHQKLAEERFKILFEQLKIPALIFGDGQIRNVNESGQRYFGINESREYSNLHPAILFPLYQLDGHSSLEKLKSALGETKEGKVVHQDWLFQLNDGKEVAGLISLFNIPYPTVDLHIMLIHDDSKRFEFERRLVDTNRKALHARRVKLEYITQMGVVLDELVDLVDTEIRENEKVELGHAHKLREIKTQLEYLWGENINHGLAESSNTVLTDFKSMMDGLHKRWTRSAKEKLSEVDCKYFEDVDQYLWLDSIKLKLALNNLVMGAIDYKERSHIEIEVKTKFQNSRYGKISFLVKTTAKNWIQSDWTVLSQISNKPSEDKGIAAMRTSRIEDLRVRENTDFINLVELLQGEVFFDRDEETVGIGFSCAIERVIGVSSDILNDVTENPGDQENTISASEIWSHFGGDWDIIENTIKDFFDYYPTAISDLYYYLEDKNSEKILEISTDLYGVITHFPFFSAIERVVRIQKYSKYLHFDKIENELTLLNHELNSFHRALSDFLPQKRLKAA
jgi:PAS domain-containing protein